MFKLGKRNEKWDDNPQNEYRKRNYESNGSAKNFFKDSPRITHHGRNVKMQKNQYS